MHVLTTSIRFKFLLSFLVIVAHSIFVCGKEYVFEKEILVSIDAVCEEDDSREPYSPSNSLDTDESESEDEDLLSDVAQDEKKHLEEHLIESVDRVSIRDSRLKQLSNISSGNPDQSNQSKTKEQLLPSKMSENERNKLENHLLKKMIRKKNPDQSNESKTKEQLLPSKMSENERNKLENHLLKKMIRKKNPYQSNESKTKEQLLPSKMSENERQKLENHLLKKMNSSVRNRLEALAGVDSDEVRNLDQLSPSKMSQEMRAEFENHFFSHMINNDYQMVDQYLLAKMNSDEIRELNQVLLNDMSYEEREKLERDPLLKMDHFKQNELCMMAKEEASLIRDDTGLHSYVHLYKIRKDEIGDINELKTKTVVAIRCASVPGVYLRLGDSYDQIKIMFSYSFSVEAIGWIDDATVSNREIRADFEKNHFLTLAQEQLWTICHITTKHIPLENISIKENDVELGVFEINYPAKFQKPKIRDLIIKCPSDPISIYLRFSPDNQIKIMIIKNQLQRLLGLSLESEETEATDDGNSLINSTVTRKTDKQDSPTNSSAASS